ncbi:MAG: N-acetylmuramoyl-L-alanine amidase [Muribaculaceae bacterium]|nr:N-acetylmuramoyl-L-alanine amidase [Muribaculaceae bacterium]
MKTIKTIALAATLATAGTLAAKTPLNIYRGEQDTVYKAQHIVVATTTPGNKATINGQDIHVYKTGAFGTQVNLAKGNNTITVTASNGKKTAKKTFKVFLADKPAAKQPAAEPEYTQFDQPLYITTRDDAYLQYGDGSDRLGGSKMGYIDSDITLKAVGQVGKLYKIELSDNRWAYMPMSCTRPSDNTTKHVNTGSWSISNTGHTDRVSISLPCRLPYRSWTQLDPTTICVEIFGAMNNSNWITTRGQLGIIDYIDCQQTDSDVLKVVIKLRDKYSWGYSVKYIGNSLAIDVKHTPSLDLKDLTIGLDAGHGGEFPGAKSATGIAEKDVNLDITLRIADLLRQRGAKIVFSREGDTGPTMSERRKTFADANIDLLISTHNNSGGSPLTTMGTSTYYKHVTDRTLAQCMLNRLLELDLKNFGLTGNFNFSLNSPTEYPNVLLEVLFMSSLPEEEKLADPEFRQQVAEKAVLGLEDYLNKVKESL